MKKKSSDNKIKHLVPNNPEYDRETQDPEEVAAERRVRKKMLYDSSYKTASGHWKRRDEPGEPRKTEYLQISPDALKKQKQWDARQRLKQKPGGVPTRKDGRKLFDQFMKEARSHRPVNQIPTVSSANLEDLKNLYNAATVLEFEQWVVFRRSLIS